MSVTLTTPAPRDGRRFVFAAGNIQDSRRCYNVTMRIPADIPAQRRAEYEGLFSLLMRDAAPGDPDAPAIADRVVRGALESGHLWRVMGLDSRAELRELMSRHFPELAAGNTKDMRWKKYLYKRLCGWPGFSG